MTHEALVLLVQAALGGLVVSALFGSRRAPVAFGLAALVLSRFL